MRHAMQDTGTTKTIVVAKEFSTTPMGRDEQDGKYNGTKFRESFLIPAITNSDIEQVNVDLNNLLVTGSSFLEEAFGGLVRSGIDEKDLSKLKIISDREDLIIEVEDYIKDALSAKKRSNNRPK